MAAALAAASAVADARAATNAESSWDAPLTWNGVRGAEKAAPAAEPPPAATPSPAIPPAATPPARVPASPAPAPAAAPWPPPAAEISAGGFFDRWVAGRLALGAGLRMARLTDNHRPPRPGTGETFVGNLTALDLENETDWAPVATYRFARHFRAALSWESIEARTFNYNRDDPYGARGQTDGIVEISGPVALLELAWPCFGDTLFPHAGAGLFFGSADFREDAFWNLNYGSEAAWAADGRRTEAPRGVYREIRVDDAIGEIVSAGLSWRPAKHFRLDLDVRKTWVDADCVFGYNWLGNWKPQKSGDFSLDHVAWTLSAAYVF